MTAFYRNYLGLGATLTRADTLGRPYKVHNGWAIEQAHDFDELFRLISAAVKPIPGIGELYVYDTSLRIGAKLNLFPTKVYLHAGTRLEAQALGLDDGAGTLKISAMPKEFYSMEPHEIEDILCIFKDELKTVSAAPIVQDIVKRSSCT